MQIKNISSLIFSAIIVSSSFCHAELSSEQIAELLRKKNAKMFEMNEEGKKIMRENHEQFIKILNSKNFNQDVLEFLHKMSLIGAIEGKPHAFSSTEFDDNIGKESWAAQEKAIILQIEFNKLRSPKKFEDLTEEEKKKIFIAMQRHINASWDALVARAAWLVWSQDIINKSKR